MSTYVPESGQEYSPDRLDREFQGIKRVLDEVPQYGSWRAIRAGVATRGVGATDPNWTQVGSGPFYAYTFSLNDEAWLYWTLPPDILPDSPLYFDVSWFGDGTDANTVKWSIDYSYTKGYDQEAVNTTGTNLTVEEAASATAYQVQNTFSTELTLSNIDEPGGIFMAYMKRVTNGGTDNADNIFSGGVRLVYRSTNSATESKEPNFYR